MLQRSITEPERKPATRVAVPVVFCSHCRLPVPPGLVRRDSEHQFCCGGCESVFGVVHACGMGRYYELLGRAESDSSRSAGRPPNRANRKYAEFDDPTFLRLYCRAAGREGGLLRTEFLLEGVHCTACVWLVERLPHVAPGVVEARLDIRRAALQITFDPKRIALSKIARTLQSLGYPPHAAFDEGSAVAVARLAEDRRSLIRIAVAGACAGNIMLLFFALYAGMFEGIEPAYEQMFRWVAMILNTICLAWPGAVFVRSAVASIRTRSLHLDVPIALGLYLGGAWGIWKTVGGGIAGAGAGDIYFDSISALVFFLLIGRFVQQRQQRRAADAVGLLFTVTPVVARRVENNGSTVDVPSEALVPGEVVEVRAGDSVPADGVVISGASDVDISLLTGESRPVRLGCGAAVAAGSVNLTAVLRIRVDAVGQETRVAQLMQMVEDASKRRAAIVRLADKFGKWLLWILLALAATTLAIWWHAGPMVALDRAAALLIATCPCGLGLVTPLAMTVAIGRASRRGILIKGGDVLQSLARRENGRTIVLDKTGTITFGTMAVVWWKGEQSARRLVAALEVNSSHPVAKALVRDFSDLSKTLPVSSSSEETLGAGIEGTVDGHCVIVGNREFLKSKGIPVSQWLEIAGADALDAGLSPVYASVDGDAVGVAALGDPVRPDAAPAIKRFQSAGWRVVILSGDHPTVVAGVARQLGLDPKACRAGVTPEGKLEFVQGSARANTTVMIGDGVNDAAALAAATVGIAVRGGAEASLAAADVSLSTQGLGPVVELLEGSRHTMRTIHVTIACSLIYNVIAASLAIAGMITPLLAAIIMPASSLTVLTICLRSGMFRVYEKRSKGVTG